MLKYYNLPNGNTLGAFLCKTFTKGKYLLHSTFSFSYISKGEVKQTSGLFFFDAFALIHQVFSGKKVSFHSQLYPLGYALNSHNISH